jgi:hypothetical protein
VSVRLWSYNVYAVVAQRVPFAVPALFSYLFFAESKFRGEMRDQLLLVFCEVMLELLCHILLIFILTEYFLNWNELFYCLHLFKLPQPVRRIIFTTLLLWTPKHLSLQRAIEINPFQRHPFFFLRLCSHPQIVLYKTHNKNYQRDFSHSKSLSCFISRSVTHECAFFTRPLGLEFVRVCSTFLPEERRAVCTVFCKQWGKITSHVP